MYDKAAILKKLLPKAVLEPLTPEMKSAISVSMDGSGLVRVNSFPFKVGRESRVRQIDGRLVLFEREKASSAIPNNDLYLIDSSSVRQFS